MFQVQDGKTHNKLKWKITFILMSKSPRNAVVKSSFYLEMLQSNEME